MAVKKNLYDKYSYADLFDTADYLDAGLLGSVKVGEMTESGYKENLLGIKVSGSDYSKTSDINAATSEEMGSLLGQSSALAANKKRKLEQKTKAQQGFGVSQSILGGSAF